MPTSLVIKNARIVNEGTITEGDLSISSNRIEKVGGVIDGTNEVDANGAWLIPGMIDDQVHFREPGLEHKGSIATESRAAIAGGITSYMEMPNCDPLTINAKNLVDKHRRAAKKSMANYAFYLGATNDNLEDIKSVDIKLACGVKVFMGASTGNMLVDNPDSLEAIFANSPLLIATHCEDTPTIESNQRKAEVQFGENIPISHHPIIRSEDACFISSSLAVDLARRHNARLHVLHLTTEKEMVHFESGPIKNKRITAEACVHHLYFNQESYEEKGAYIKCNPAIKTPKDQAALIAAIQNDTIDVIATDHAPHTQKEKTGTYTQTAAGLPLVQHALLSLMEHVTDDVFSIEKIVHKTSHAPAELFQVQERGYIREGYWADLAIIDTKQSTIVNEEPIYAKCGWSPFSNTEFRSRITHTFVNGNLVYADGRITSDLCGMPLEYTR